MVVRGREKEKKISDVFGNKELKIPLCIFISNDVMEFFFIVQYVQNEM